MEFVTSQKNTRKLSNENYLFTKHRDGSQGIEIWHCEVRTCCKRVHTKNETIVQENGEHNHAVGHGKSAVESARTAMKQDASNSVQPTRVVVSRALLNIPSEMSNLLPGKDSLAQDVRRHRQQARDCAHNMTSLALTVEGNNFLRVDEDDLKIFAADVDIQFLSECDHWFADGTFRVTPSGFAQLYTLHGFRNDRTFPCVYALLSGKSEEIYTDFLTRLMTLRNNQNPVTIMTDFELAVIKALKLKFPGVTMSGCMFHFGQCVWRKLQEFGIGGHIQCGSFVRHESEENASSSISSRRRSSTSV